MIKIGDKIRLTPLLKKRHPTHYINTSLNRDYVVIIVDNDNDCTVIDNVGNRVIMFIDGGFIKAKRGIII